jgi:hypothetical protein
MVVPIKFAASSIIIKKELPYTKFINHHINKLRGSGIMQHLLEKHATKKPLCQTEENPKSIPFKKVVFPFFIYMIGVISALAIFFIELIIAHRNEKIQMGKRNHKIEKYPNKNEIGVQCDLILESVATLHRRISI